MIDAEQLVGTADVLGAEVIEGEIRAKIGNAAEALGHASGLPLYGPDGFISYPDQPSENGDACQALYVIDGDGKIIVGTRDNRYASKVGSLEPGDRAIVTAGEARVIIKREDDAVFIMSKDPSTGKDVIWELNGTAGVLQMFCGGCYITMKGNKITLGAGDGTNSTIMSISPAGVQIDGANFLCCTAGGHLGLLVPPIAGAPGVPPVAPVNSIVMGPTGVAGVGSSKWTVSP